MFFQIFIKMRNVHAGVVFYSVSFRLFNQIFFDGIFLFDLKNIVVRSSNVERYVHKIMTVWFWDYFDYNSRYRDNSQQKTARKI